METATNIQRSRSKFNEAESKFIGVVRVISNELNVLQKLLQDRKERATKEEIKGLNAELDELYSLNEAVLNYLCIEDENNKKLESFASKVSNNQDSAVVEQALKKEEPKEEPFSYLDLQTHVSFLDLQTVSNLDLQTYLGIWRNLSSQKNEIKKREAKVQKREEEIKLGLLSVENQILDMIISVVKDYFNWILKEQLKEAKIAVDTNELENIENVAVNQFFENMSAEIKKFIKRVLSSNSGEIKGILQEAAEDFLKKSKTSYFKRSLAYNVKLFLRPYWTSGMITRTEYNQMRNIIVKKFMEREDAKEMDIAEDRALIESFLSNKGEEIRMAAEEEIQKIEKV